MGGITSDFLTADSGFLTGLGSSMNIAGNFYGFNTAPNANEADRRAMLADWMIVGQDLADAMDKAESHPECLITP